MKPKYRIVIDDSAPAFSQSSLDNLKEDSLVEFNHEAEPRFCRLLCELLDEVPNLGRKQAINELAFRLNISPVTSRRYLEKHTTITAQFEIVEKIVRCKVHRHGKRPQIRVLKNSYIK